MKILLVAHAEDVELLDAIRSISGIEAEGAFDQDSLTTAALQDKDIVIVTQRFGTQEQVIQTIQWVRRTSSARVIFVGDDCTPGHPLLSAVISLGVYDCVYLQPGAEGILFEDIVARIFHPNSYKDVASLHDLRMTPVVVDTPGLDIEEGLDLGTARQLTVAFWGAKPGVGASTLALNTALLLADAGYRTVLVELDSFYPSVALRLGVSSQDRNVVNALKDLRDNRLFQIKENILTPAEMATMLPDNLKLLRPRLANMPDLGILSIPDDVTFKDFPEVSSNDIKAFMEWLVFRLNYDTVILDLPSTFNNELEGALKYCRQVVAVLEPCHDVILQFKQILPVYEKLGITGLREKMQIVVNKSIKSADYSKEQVERMLGGKVSVFVPCYPQVVAESHINNDPLCFLETCPRDLADGLREVAGLVRRLAVAVASEERQKRTIKNRSFSLFRRQKFSGRHADES